MLLGGGGSGDGDDGERGRMAVAVKARWVVRCTPDLRWTPDVRDVFECWRERSSWLLHDVQTCRLRECTARGVGAAIFGSGSGRRLSTRGSNPTVRGSRQSEVEFNSQWMKLDTSLEIVSDFHLD